MKERKKERKKKKLHGILSTQWVLKRCPLPIFQTQG